MPGPLRGVGLFWGQTGIWLGGGDEKQIVSWLEHRGMEHRRNVAGRIWGEARHSPSAPGYRFDLLQNIWDVGSGDPTPPQGVRKKIIAVFFAFWNLKGSRPPKPTPPHAQTLSDWARGKPRCEAVLLNHILNYSLFSHTCCRQVAVPSRDISGQYHWQEKILFFLN